MPQADGRVVDEALRQPSTSAEPSVVSAVLTPQVPATGLRFELPTDPTGAHADPALPAGRYTIELAVKDLRVGGRSYRYFDYAKAVRQ
jgi:hypothetical protein